MKLFRHALAAFACLSLAGCLSGCSTPGTSFTKAPELVTPDGEQWGSSFDLDFDAGSGEFVVWDKWDGNITLGSTADTGLEGLRLRIDFEGEEVSGVDLRIDKREADASKPTTAAWEGLAAYAESVGMTAAELLERAAAGIVEGVTPTP